MVIRTMKQFVNFSLALVTTIGATSAIAHAEEGEINAGAFLGLHVFSENNELGVLDDPTSDSQSNGPPLGVRASYGVVGELSIEGELGLVPTKMRDTGVGSTVFVWRVHALYEFLAPSQKLRPFAVAGGGFMSTSQSGDGTVADTDPALYGGGGASYRINDDWSVRGDARLVFPPSSEGGFASTDYEALVGASYTFGSKTEEPETLVEVVDETSCVDGVGPGCPPADEDGDGIVGEADKCPDQAETANSFEDDDGCPDEAPDTDGDGISDPTDSCIDTPEDMDSFEDTDGCPEEDNDKDGLVDAMDSCPIELGPVENRGCPDTDRDEDTVVDRLDNCPDEKGTVENHGCEAEQLVVIAKGELQILDKVYFARGIATIEKRTYPLLNNLAAVLANHPEIETVEISGHTDGRGSADKNLALSQYRAEAVRRYLVSKGVEKKRLKPVGYGETMPVVKGNDKAASEANRRVEFKLITK